jgi:hypothetical protein
MCVNKVQLAATYQDNLTYPILVRRTGGGHDIVEMLGCVVNAHNQKILHSPPRFPTDRGQWHTC